MQTFLPYPNFADSAQVLDRQRLGNQRKECLQILRAIAGIKAGWRNHPCTRMWENHPEALVQYTITVCAEWQSRLYEDNCLTTTLEIASMMNWKIEGEIKYPLWLGRQDIHASHRSNLLRKLPEYYSQFGWTEPNDLEYVWK